MLELYHQMWLIHCFEERSVKLFKRGVLRGTNPALVTRLLLWGPVMGD